MALLSQRGWDEWIAAYAASHRHPVNRACHAVGIPLIVASIAVAAVGIRVAALRPIAWRGFVAGWALQFVGHAFERKRPELFNDPRFLFVGLRWWIAKLRGRA